MLIPCPSCGKQISDRAPRCPFCRGDAPAAGPGAHSIIGPEEISRDLPAPPAPALTPPAPKPVAPVAAPRSSPARIQVPEALPAYQRGDFIGDLLQVIQILGEGGFGIVYLARSLASNDIVALKTLHGELLRDQRTRALFEKEAKIWIELGAHPNLVRAKWVDEIGGRLYIAMEYVRAGAGRPNGLEGHLENGPIPIDRALLWGVQFCRGMEYAVSKGIRCHRDIKPANILIGDDGVVKISDFGIAGLALVPEAPSDVAAAPLDSNAADPARTAVGTVFGTPTHMSPEQFVDAASCDERSDIYSFGVVLYQMASSGRLPFHPPPPPPELRAQAGAYYWHAFSALHTSAVEAPLGSPLAAIVTRCLHKKREERYQTFAALRADLESLYEKTKGEKAPAQSGGAESVRDWNDRGISLATLERFGEALECYDKALAFEPDSQAVHNNRGNALRNLGRVDEALGEFDRAIALDPLYPAAWENKALLYARAQRNHEALVCIERSLTLDPTNAGCLVTRGVLLGRLDRPADELAAYDSALRIDARNVEAWFNKANALSALDRPEALGCVDQALACDPAYVSGWDLKGTLMAELGRANEAVACHQEARRLDPRDARLAYNLGNAWVAIGRMEEARAAFLEATRLPPEMPIAWYNLALATLQVGQHAQSLPLFERFLSFNPGDDGPRRTAERLTRELKAGRTPSMGPISVGSRIAAEEKATIDAQALPELQEVKPASASPSGASVGPPSIPQEPLPLPLPSLLELNQQAASHFNAGRLAEALNVVESILKIERRDANALHTRANAFFKLDRKDEACATIVLALEASPGELPIWLNKAFIDNGAGRARAAYRSAIDLVEIAQVGGAVGGAVDQARRLINTLQSKGVTPNPRSHLGWLGLGYASMVAGRSDAALDFLEKALAEAPRNVEVLRWKAGALKELRRADDSLAVYEEALALAPEDPEIHHDRAVVLAMLREFSRAVEGFDSALALNPNHVASLSDKGKYAGELGRHEVALEALRRAAALVPDHPAPRLNKALVEDLLGRDEEALTSFEQFLARAKPEMRLQIESSKRRVEQLRARVAARKGTPALRPLAAAQPQAATPSAPSAPSHGAVLEGLDNFFSEEGDMSDEELAGLAEGMSAQGAGSLMDALRALSPGGGVPTAVPSASLVETRTPGPGAAVAPPAGPPPPAAPRPTGNPVAKKWAEQGRAHLAAQKPVEALAALEKAIERDPNEALYWGDRGVVLKRLSRHDQARASWAKALTLNGLCVPALMGMASEEIAAGRHAQAIELLMRATGADPTNAKAWFELGDAYARACDWKYSYAAFSLSHKIEPLKAHAILGMAEAAMNLERPEDALVALDAALAIDDSIATAWFFRGVLLSHKGLLVEAVESHRRAVELDPGRVNAWYNLAHDLLGLKRYLESIEAATRALQLRPDFASALNLKGLGFQGLRRYEEAVAAFDQSLVADSLSASVWANKGASLLSLKKSTEALACFARSLELEPGYKPAREGSAAAEAAIRSATPVKVMDHDQGGVGGALVLPEVSVPNTASRFSQDECLKRSEMARNQALFDRALEFADQAIAADPRKYTAWASKAEALFGLKRFAESAAHARKAIDINPKFAPAWVRLAACYDAVNALESALSAWDKAVELAGQNVLNWNARGLCLERMRRLEEGLASHEKALAIDPRFSLGKFHKGRIEAELGRREAAIKSLQQFLSLAPPNLAALAHEARQRIQELKA